MTKTNSKTKFIILTLIVVAITAVLLALFLFKRTSNPISNNSDHTLLAKTIYNETTKDNKELLPFELNEENNQYSNNFSYSSLKLINSFYFTTTFDFNLDPYITKDHINQEVEIVIANIELLGNGKYTNNNWYTQKLLIIKYLDEVVGFLSPTMSIVGKSELSDLYTFVSSIFLTKDSVVKYYENEDVIYTFNVDASNKENILIDITYQLAFVENTLKSSQSTSISNSFIELENNITISLIEKVIVEKVFTEAKIISLDINNKIIYVTSTKTPSLVSVNVLNSTILNIIGDEITFNDLVVDDTIYVYYYIRNSSYLPVDIYTDIIMLAR